MFTIINNVKLCCRK